MNKLIIYIKCVFIAIIKSYKLVRECDKNSNAFGHLLKKYYKEKTMSKKKLTKKQEKRLPKKLKKAIIKKKK